MQAGTAQKVSNAILSGAAGVASFIFSLAALLYITELNEKIVAALVAGAVIVITGWTPIDPLLSLLVAAIICGIFIIAIAVLYRELVFGGKVFWAPDSMSATSLHTTGRKLLDQGQAGDNIGALLRGTKKEEVERGQVLCKPGSITPHTEFEGQVYVLTKEEGGRHKPFFANYRPQFYFRTTDITGIVELPEGTEMCMPGDNTLMKVTLIHPIAMDEGLRFAIREGGRTVGAGRVTKIIK